MTAGLDATDDTAIRILGAGKADKNEIDLVTCVTSSAHEAQLPLSCQSGFHREGGAGIDEAAALLDGKPTGA